EGASGRERELRGELLVDVDPVPQGLPRHHVAVARLRAAREDFLGPGREDVPFVNAEVVARQLERELSRVGHGRSVPGTVPGRLDREELRERGDLARRTEASDLR